MFFRHALVLDGVKKKIDDMKDNHKWQELFVNTGHFFINNSDMVTRFESDLYLVFSEDNLKTLAKKLKDKSGYEFPELLHEELYDLMIRYEIPVMQAETYIHHFMKVIINYLEKNDPDRALELYLGDLKKEIDQNFSAIEEKFELVLSKIAELNEAKVVLYSVSDIDVQIRRMSKYKGMGLDFFELDDEQFESRFQSAINKELIYIVGKSREETTYRILNELRQNQRLREEEIRVGFKEFKENKYSLDKLIELAVQEDNILGEVLAQFYSDGMFDEEVFHLLMRKDKEGKHVFDYVRYLHRYGSVDLKDVIEMVKRISDNKNLLVNLISLEFIEDDVNALIAKEDEEIKTMYWSRNTRARISDHAGHQVFLWALNECEKYGTCDNYFELLYDVREKISIQELYDATVKISDMKGGIASSMTIYYIGEILKELQDAFITDDEKCAELVSVEWLCRNILEWEQMRCMQKSMKNDPKIYADLVGIVYKTEDDESGNKGKGELASAVYAGFDKARFCPAEKDGKVSYEALKKWVEEFKGLLIKQKQENLFGHLIGRLLAYSPNGADDYHPCEAVREIIEEYDSDSLRSSYIVAEENKRGVHTVDAGKSEMILYQRYLKNAKGLQVEYPKTAEIYFTLSEDYKREAEYERKRAEDEW